MLVLGLDPGLALTGWALVEGDRGRLRLRDAGYWETSPRSDAGSRLVHLWDSLGQLLVASSPESVAIEKLFFSRNASSAMAVSQARGVLVCAAAKAGLEIAEYTPAEIKQSVTGSGAADKAQLARMVQMILEGPIPAGPDEITDACAIGICHQHSFKLRRALTRVGM